MGQNRQKYEIQGFCPWCSGTNLDPPKIQFSDFSQICHLCPEIGSMEYYFHAKNEKKLMRTLKAGQFCPHLPPFGSNNSIQAFFPTFSPKGLKANGQKALFIARFSGKGGGEKDRKRDRDGPEFKNNFSI